MTGTQLARSMLKDRKSAWLTFKQTAYLADTLSRERGDQVRHRSYFLNTDEINHDPHGYEGC